MDREIGIERYSGCGGQIELGNPRVREKQHIYGCVCMHALVLSLWALALDGITYESCHGQLRREVEVEIE